MATDNPERGFKSHTQRTLEEMSCIYTYLERYSVMVYANRKKIELPSLKGAQEIFLAS